MRSAVDVTGSGSTPGIDEENQMHGSGWKTFRQNREAWVRTLHRANGTDKSATHNGWYGLRKETDSFRIADDAGAIRELPVDRVARKSPTSLAFGHQIDIPRLSSLSGSTWWFAS